jgi:hypothetical protein
MMRSISWEIGIDSADQGEPLILRRDVMKDQLDQAGNLCVVALGKHFSLDSVTLAGINSALDNTHSWVTFGQEGRGAESGVYPVGVIQSNVVNLQSRLVSVESVAPPQVRISLEGVAEEATNLLETAQLIVNGRKQDSISEKTKEVVGTLIEDRQLLLDAASRIAAARRLLKYVLLPKRSIPPNGLDIGFGTWFNEQFERRGGKKPSKKALSDILENYKASELALKNLRRTAWAPIFFRLLDIDFGDFAFYLEYRQQVSRNHGHTVTFSSPLTILLEQNEASRAFECVFGSDKKPDLKLV